MRIIATLIAVLVCTLNVQAQRVGFAYWNVDRLCDTLRSPFRDDGDYTPQGRYRWNTERYLRKVRAVAAVADSMAMPVTVLFGVENEAVVRDIAEACTADYSYLHRTLDSRDGLEFALLYFGDALQPQRVTATGGCVRVDCRIAGRKCVLLMSRNSAAAEDEALRARRDSPDAALIVMGRTGTTLPAVAGVADSFAAEERAGRGTVVQGGVWRFDGRICADTLLRTRAAVYARRRLFDRTGKAPAPTVARGRYAGGVSRSLPLLLTVEWPDGEQGGE